jgi:hypothetical protein
MRAPESEFCLAGACGIIGVQMLRDMEKKTFTGDGWTSVEMGGLRWRWVDFGGDGWTSVEMAGLRWRWLDFGGDGWTSVEMAGVSGGLAKAVNQCSAM